MSKHACRIPQKFWTLVDDLCTVLLRTKEVQDEILWHERSIIKAGHLRRLCAKRAGPGIYELGIEPLVAASKQGEPR